MRSVLETKQEKDARSCSASFFIAGNGLNALSGALITDRKRYEKSNEKVTILARDCEGTEQLHEKRNTL